MLFLSYHSEAHVPASCTTRPKTGARYRSTTLSHWLLPASRWNKTVSGGIHVVQQNCHVADLDQAIRHILDTAGWYANPMSDACLHHLESYFLLECKNRVKVGCSSAQHLEGRKTYWNPRAFLALPMYICGGLLPRSTHVHLWGSTILGVYCP